MTPVVCHVGFPLALSVGFPRQERWSGLPFPPLGDRLARGLNPRRLRPALAGGLLTTPPPGSPAPALASQFLVPSLSLGVCV